MLILSLVIFVKSIFIFICVALAVGFYTLMERKVLGYIQSRKGPNKVGFVGLPQPLADAVKLFSKESLSISLSNKFLYVFSPVVAVFIMFTLWIFYMSSYGMTGMKLGVLVFLVVSSLNVYTVLLSGWSSNSKYALLGAIRAVAQTISYEVSLALVIMVLLFLSSSLDFFVFVKVQKGLWFLFVIPVIFVMWMITSLAETNRAPFDLAEGESELVSGFNIEYGSGEFAFLFIAEYGSILFMSMLTCCFFMGGTFFGMGLFGIMKVVFISFLFLWVRASYPRMRYDVLMHLTWKTFLLLVIAACCFFIGMSVI